MLFLGTHCTAKIGSGSLTLYCSTRQLKRHANNLALAKYFSTPLRKLHA